MTENAVKVTEYSFSYNPAAVILKNISLSTGKGAFCGIIGPNGCGKTTLLRNIAAQLPARPRMGEILLMGQNAFAMGAKQLAKTVAVINQREHIAFDFTAYELVLMGRTPYLPRFSRESPEDRAIALSAMRRVNCYHYRDKSINEISGGELQRVLIARMLAQRSPVFLLDEPVSSLDIGQQLQIMETLKQVSLSEQAAVLCVLHDINLAARFCGELYLLKDGEIVAAGAPETVITGGNIRRAYGVDADIQRDKTTNRPVIVSYHLYQE